MKTIPEVRQELRSIATQLATAAEELHSLANFLYRRTPAPRARARAKSKPVSPAIARHIRGLRRRNPEASLQWIAQLVGVNPGRVSEVLHGKRKGEKT